jgi:hypothetical protein
MEGVQVLLYMCFFIKPGEELAEPVVVLPVLHRRRPVPSPPARFRRRAGTAAASQGVDLAHVPVSAPLDGVG